MHFDITILGSNGAVPAYNRNPTSQFLNYNGHGFLIDCGEGTQMQMAKYSIRRGKLDYIFISHIHGDHFFGLMGLLTSFNLNHRETPLHIYGHFGIEEIVNTHFKHSQTKLGFDVFFHPVLADFAKIIYEDDALTVETIILEHRIPTTGFLFKEKIGLRKILAQKIQEYNIPITEIINIKKGANFINKEGSTIYNSELTEDPTLPRSYAFCSDTVYTESFIEQIKNVNVLYHEATFLNEHDLRASETMHSTAKQAATIAKKANVGRLLIGHFSARYENLEPLLLEAKVVFPNTELAIEGTVFPVDR